MAGLANPLPGLLSEIADWYNRNDIGTKLVGGGVRGAATRGLLGMDAPKEATPIQREVYENAARAAAPALGAGKAIFIGAKAKTWNKANADKFLELEKQGVKTDEAWRQTQTMRLPEGPLAQEISDHAAKMTGNSNARTVGEAFDHPELYAAYPEMANYPFTTRSTYPGARGSFDPQTKEVFINPLLDASNQRSSMVHELTHGVQHNEGFGTGGNPRTAFNELQKYKNEALSPYVNDSLEFDTWSRRRGELGRALYQQKLDEMTRKSGIKPSSVHNLADWYQYSNEIRSIYGAEPKRAGPQRDAWLQNAAKYILDKNTQGMSDPWNSPYRPGGMPSDELKKAYRSADRKAEKHADGAKTYNGIDARYKKIGSMSDFQVYERLPGEAMARLSQTRIDKTPQERGLIYAMDELDIPLSEYGAGGLLKP